MKDAKIVQSLVLLLALALQWSGVVAQTKITSYADLPVGKVMEAEFPDGVVRLVATESERISKQLDEEEAVIVAIDIATLKAEASLASFVNGSEMERSGETRQVINRNSAGDDDFSESFSSRHSSTMRATALRGVEVIAIQDDRNKGVVRVTVGLSEKTIGASGKYRALLGKE